MKNKYKTVFLSDTHLGSRHCKATHLLSFLKGMDCEALYLVGDIFDIWALESGKLHWKQEHSEIIRRLIKISRKSKVYYIVGNHDAILRPYLNMTLGNIHIKNHHVHTTNQGKKFLVTHGDGFDRIIVKHKWLAKLGSKIYEKLIDINTIFNRLRHKLGFKYWSLSKYLKHTTKSITGIINSFQNTLLSYAKQKGYDGVICGHIHSPQADRDKHYYNCGDWIESLSYLAEHYDGNIYQYNYIEKDI